MKKITLLFMLSVTVLCAFQVANQHAQLKRVDGKKLAGKWLAVTNAVSLKYADGSVQNVSVDGEPDQYLEFKYAKNLGGTAEGTFSSAYGGVVSPGNWTLDESKNELVMIFSTDGKNMYQYRKIEQLDAHTLILRAEDAEVLRSFEANGLNNNGYKKLIGGTVVETYKR